MSDKPSKMERVAEASQHEGHDPRDERTMLVEELASRLCGYCAHGDHRWRDRDDDGVWVHTEEFGYDANECEASNVLSAAVAIGVPVYTGAELEFPTSDAA